MDGCLLLSSVILGGVVLHLSLKGNGALFGGELLGQAAFAFPVICPVSRQERATSEEVSFHG